MAQTRMRGERREDLRIVLVGKTGVGKSTSGNIILGWEAFQAMFCCASVTKVCKKERAEVDGRDVYVIDTPGLFDTGYSNEETAKEIVKCICLSSPGPHVFLIVLQLGRFTKEEQDTVKMIREIFGEESAKYTMVLFTHGEKLGTTTIEECLSPNKQLKDFIAECFGGYYVFNNAEPKNNSEATELLQKIDKMVMMNGGGYYSTEMYKKFEAAIEKKKAQILKETEEKRKREQEKLEKQIKEKEELEKARAREELRKKQEEEARRKAELDTAHIIECTEDGAIGGGLLGILGGALAGGLMGGPIGALIGAGAGIAGGAGAGAAGGAAVGAVEKDKCTIQ